ncbi:uncharacterized protein EI97DRAFT_321716 [Westerdykella ornata]|uniref:Uncharacterized protein n=1 Tax=Westerdykella ornata TaxID=318751 RepID=A0A6A6JPC4_WESOR|nr:uncharacterized protein EI97DRAFT_321716 [Westerdykella ornata]KAF2276799.1 hypothetical protein EI97DRAFT_321716 [Westerdykella ornata]
MDHGSLLRFVKSRPIHDQGSGSAAAANGTNGRPSPSSLTWALSSLSLPSAPVVCESRFFPSSSNPNGRPKPTRQTRSSSNPPAHIWTSGHPWPAASPPWAFHPHSFTQIVNMDRQSVCSPAAHCGHTPGWG